MQAQAGAAVDYVDGADFRVAVVHVGAVLVHFVEHQIDWRPGGDAQVAGGAAAGILDLADFACQPFQRIARLGCAGLAGVDDAGGGEASRNHGRPHHCEYAQQHDGNDQFDQGEAAVMPAGRCMAQKGSLAAHVSSSPASG